MNSSGNYIEVAVTLPVFDTYTYHVPEALSALAAIGKRVLVPFQQRRVTGFVIGEGVSVQHVKIKTILDVLDDAPLFTPSMVPFFKWAADYYLHPVGNVIKSALPGGLNIYDLSMLTLTRKGIRCLKRGQVDALEKSILDTLTPGRLSMKALNRRLGDIIPNALIHSMVHRGYIERQRVLNSAGTRPKMERYVTLSCTSSPPAISDRPLSQARQKIVGLLQERGEISVKELQRTVPTAPRLVRLMALDGGVTLSERRIYRDPLGAPIKPDREPVLTQEQEKVVGAVLDAMGHGFSAYLLAGVTGSGKTEVYLRLAGEARRRGTTVLVLVPEIGLISQMVRRFRARFGDCVAVLHSGLSAGERYDQWVRIAEGHVSIAIGARSAIFAPFQKIGLIIVDEEHDTSYKQEHAFRYNARDMAVVRSKLAGAVVLLGSATPSIQSYHNVTIRKFTELSLTKRVAARELPVITVVDLCKCKDNRGIRRFISPELHLALKETLARRQQAILFLNRRGFASFPVCKACGEAIRCRNCHITLTLHQKDNAYRCHYCGFTRPFTSSCRCCGSTRIHLLGLGTEKLEAAIRTLFPDARVARMDRDTTTRKGAVVRVLKGLRDGTTDILVGTQMVTKGHDFPNITLVGIICADLSLNFPDFRAGERTFQLLAQASGRAGRGETPGRVILQTYSPDHFSVMSAKHQDFKAFYHTEIEFRKSLSYPPFSRMVMLRISGKDKEKTQQHAMAVGKAGQALKLETVVFSKNISIMGPIEAPLTKIANRYRWQILLKSPAAGPLHRFVNRLVHDYRFIGGAGHVKVDVDVDPFSML